MERKKVTEYFYNKIKRQIWQAYARNARQFKNNLPSQSLKLCAHKLSFSDNDFQSKRIFIRNVLDKMLRLRFKWISARDKRRGTKLHREWQSRFIKCKSWTDLLKVFPNRASQNIFSHSFDNPSPTVRIFSEVDCGSRRPDLVGFVGKKRAFIIEIKSTRYYPPDLVVQKAHRTQLIQSVRAFKATTKTQKVKAFLFYIIVCGKKKKRYVLFACTNH